MSKTRPLYSPEFRRQMVDLVRAGHTPEELAREFERNARTVVAFVRLAMIRIMLRRLAATHLE